VNGEQTFSPSLPDPSKANALNLAVAEKLIGKTAFYSPASLQSFTIDKFRVDS